MDHTLLPSAPVDLLESVTSLSKQWHAPPAELMSAIGYGSQLQNPCVTLGNNLIPAATAAPWMQWPLGNFPFICSGDYRPLAIQQALIMKQPSWSSILSPAFCPLPTEVNSQMPKKTQEGCIENRIKKPLNAFMLFMKEMRSKVLSECPFKESAAINQILARRWHALSKEEQAPYYEMARQEKELHSKLHPDWSARDNYGTQKERKMKKRMEVFSLYPGFPASNSIVNWTCDDPDKPSSSKKCRARLGITQQERWCRSCRLKKKCARFSKSHESSNESNAGGSSNNFIDISNIVPFLPPYIPDHWKLPNKTPITLQ